MEHIRECYGLYAGKFVNREEVDYLLSRLTIPVRKKGLVKYAEFIEKKNRRNFDACKNNVKKYFQEL